MIFIERPETDPYFNIAAEEYVLKHFAEDVLMLWQSTPSVIIGKHQNTLAEVNLDFVNQNNIPVIRRISGGGTVYHDPGNLNFTLIATGTNSDKLIDFRQFTRPVVDFLNTLGIKAEFEGKNNLRIAGQKFSGNAAHVFKKRVMHHGTLLFDTDLQQLEKSILPQTTGIRDKAVQSVRARVGNIVSHFQHGFSYSGFREAFQEFLLNYFHISEIRPFSPTDHSRIQQLADKKYRKWEWNFGYSPAYTFQNEVDGVSVKLSVKNGIIREIEIEGQMDNKALLIKKLKGVAHHPDQITEVLEFIYPNDSNSLVLSLFEF